MLLPLILFIFGIALAIGLVARKIWQLESGRIVPQSYEEADWTDLSIESIRNRVAELLKFGVHHSVLITLKGWILTSHAIKRFDHKVRERLMHIIHKNAQYPTITTDAKPSEFLSGIREHRDGVMQDLRNEASAKEE